MSLADLREANTLAEDDLFRGLQRMPGVGTRDDFSADLWTRGAPAGETAVFFDGIRVLGGLHALGAVSGLNTDMLGTATFQPGVASASVQGGAAGAIHLSSRSGLDATAGGGQGSASLSLLSARATLSGRATKGVAWAFGARRSYVDALSRLARGLGIDAEPRPHAFRDLTGRVDLTLNERSEIQTSVFWQDDRVFGDVPDISYGNQGHWGTMVAQTSLVMELGDATMRHTLGLSALDASVAVNSASSPPPLHPATENHLRMFAWESRIDGGPASGEGWSVGLRASRVGQRYNGPDVDLARLLSSTELEKRGIGDLTPIIVSLERSRLLKADVGTRVAVWGEQRRRIGEHLEIQGGLRIETGERVQGPVVRLAPRVRVRYGSTASSASVAVGYGRSFQYVQSIARTDVLRSGLRASEVFAQAGPRTPPLRSDVLTVGGEVWTGPAWLLGATLWMRASSGILIPEPTPGVIDDPRATVPATGLGRGLELSVRKLEGRLRGFANYSLSRTRHRVGSREFDASEDRRHVANIGVVGDLLPSWSLGATFRVQSGAPYTRVTLVEADCIEALGCLGRVPVLYGTPGGQRTSAFTSLDLMTEWTHTFSRWSLSVYGQLRNATGNANAITYYSSCVCGAGGTGSDAGLSDRFDRGLPRLPLIGIRARF